MKPNQTVNHKQALIILTSLFFMWGFITCLNDILIPYLKKIFELTYFRAMLVQFAFFGAYFIGSLFYLLISFWKDPISIIGYKKGIIIGLLISAFACLMFYPASEMHSYPVFLSALFILGLGFTLLQITANPFVAILGTQETASSRLNLAQGFNSLGTTIAPIIGGYFIFHFFNKWGTAILNDKGAQVLTDSGDVITALGIQIPYIIFAGIFVLLAVVFYFSKLPEVKNEESAQGGFEVFKYRHLMLGFVAIFMYVGAEVAIGSMIINYLGETMAMPEMEAKSFLAFYWGGAMIGRFLGAISLNDKYSQKKKLLSMSLISALIFLFIFTIVWFESSLSFVTFLPYIGFMILNLILFYLAKSSPSRALMLFALAIIGMLTITLFFDYSWVMWCIISIGLFNSIMWSNIFTLSIKGLGKHTAQGSSILIMAILGGALLPLLQGYLADIMGVVASFIVPLAAYIYLLYYGALGYKVKNQKN